MSRATPWNSSRVIEPGWAISSRSMVGAPVASGSPITGRCRPCRSHSTLGMDTSGNQVLFQPIALASSW